MVTERVHRTFQLLHLLQSQPGLRLKEIANWLNCSQRTVYRDLEVLKAVGVEVVWNDQGYSLANQPLAATTEVGYDELLALAVGWRAVEPRMPTEMARLLNRTLQKLLDGTTTGTRGRWLALQRMLQVDSLPSSYTSNQQACMRTAIQAIQHHRAVEIRTTTECWAAIHLCGIRLSEGHWILEAASSTHADGIQIGLRDVKDLRLIPIHEVLQGADSPELAAMAGGSAGADEGFLERTHPPSESTGRPHLGARPSTLNDNSEPREI